VVVVVVEGGGTDVVVELVVVVVVGHGVKMPHGRPLARAPPASSTAPTPANKVIPTTAISRRPHLCDCPCLLTAQVSSMLPCYACAPRPLARSISSLSIVSAEGWFANELEDGEASIKTFGRG
jgi:hypothetical protein